MFSLGLRLAGNHSISQIFFSKKTTMASFMGGGGVKGQGRGLNRVYTPPP